MTTTARLHPLNAPEHSRSAAGRICPAVKGYARIGQHQVDMARDRPALADRPRGRPPDRRARLPPKRWRGPTRAHRRARGGGRRLATSRSRPGPRRGAPRDREAPRGPLHGVPIAVKDLIDTADMPTGYGSPIYRGTGRRPTPPASRSPGRRRGGARQDGDHRIRRFHPGKTANPHNPAHTPGGSSSGSAAAVADRMVPLAFGTQTAGSVIRPAAFCGVVGYKPSFGLIAAPG